MDMALRMLDDSDARFLDVLPPAQVPRIKLLMESLVMGTDMARQKDIRSAFAAAVERHGADVFRWPRQERELAMGVLLHAADIANCSKPWHLCSGWSHRIMQVRQLHVTDVATCCRGCR